MKWSDLVIPIAIIAAFALVLRFYSSSSSTDVITSSPSSSPLPAVSDSHPQQADAPFAQHHHIVAQPQRLPASAMASSASTLVKSLIAENAVMVFSKSWCGYSSKAKRILSQYQLKSYKVLELDQRDDGDELQRVLGEMTGASSVPRVFIAGKCIGGGDDTEKLEREGKLKQLLMDAGAL